MHIRVGVRDIKPTAQMILWGKAGGRCQFRGCNQQLWKSPVTQEPVNIAQKAHIYAFSRAGPRGHKGMPKSRINNVENLMLVCHACHRTIDQDQDGCRYSGDLLQSWKAEHERRIEVVTGVHPDRNSNVVFYGAKIGETDVPQFFNSAAMAMFPEWYPADDRPILLSLMRSSFSDRNAGFWITEDDNLIRMFANRVRQPLQDGNIRHLSVFALAPQPLLVRLGSLLTDINEVQVYARSREPQGWRWRDYPRGFKFVVQTPRKISGPPALVLSLSADISEGRVRAILGNNVTFWKVTVTRPNNDFLRSKKQLQEFRELARGLMVQIEGRHGRQTELHVFPASPAAIAVELGRIRMPKANLKWRIYDQVNERQGFVPALRIS